MSKHSVSSHRSANNPQKAARASEKKAVRNPKQNASGPKRSKPFPANPGQ